MPQVVLKKALLVVNNVTSFLWLLDKGQVALRHNISRQTSGVYIFKISLIILKKIELLYQHTKFSLELFHNEYSNVNYLPGDIY